MFSQDTLRLIIKSQMVESKRGINDWSNFTSEEENESDMEHDKSKFNDN